MIGCPACGCQDYEELTVSAVSKRVTTLCQCNVCGEQFHYSHGPEPYTISVEPIK